MNKLFSFLLLIILSPILLIVSILILIDDGFPIIFRQRRIGKNKQLFMIYKFRTMKNNTPDVATHLLKSKNNFYLKSGVFMRKYSIDELPQLFNILLGDINIIGPRPALYNQYDLIELREKKGINKMKPGITGWAQVNGRDDLSIRDKVQYEKYFLENNSFYLKFKIMIMTIMKVLKAENVQK